MDEIVFFSKILLVFLAFIFNTILPGWQYVTFINQINSITLILNGA